MMSSNQDTLFTVAIAAATAALPFFVWPGEVAAAALMAVAVATGLISYGIMRFLMR